ncbi:hypothetical protein JNB71_01670 [Rhizobium herbae]|uniref:Uncharacterized protein n=1 Tax=Rhizobium herbae TaxID=508661 RepID=A0ABS7H4I8_9HYPH|nr:hypothetical protein [Rhizobium herbae]MBW9062013.1 hypothetical protein [Rhizobium herbae]
MRDRNEEAKPMYATLDEYAALRTQELSEMLRPYINVTDQYGALICRITLMLGKTPPRSKRDAALRDLMADVFDFLYEARPLIVKGKLEIAYPLARRAYESLSLMVACFLDPQIADMWSAGKQIGNAEVRRVLGKHPMGESEEKMRDLYKFFSMAAHPNRSHVAHRFLGEGNEFVLGAVGRPSLALLADYALKTLNLWNWFGVFVSFVYLDVLEKNDPEIMKNYESAKKMAQDVASWLSEQFNRVLLQEQAEYRNA